MKSRKSKYSIISIAILIMTTLQIQARAPKVAYGLHLNSYQTTGQERTKVWLNDSAAIDADDELQIAFEMDVRDEGYLWGPIMHLNGDDGQQIHFNFALNEINKFEPALLLNEDIHLFHTLPRVGETIPVSLTLNQKKGVIEIQYADIDTIINANIKNINSYRICLGRTSTNGDVAPINIRDLHINRNDKPLYFWKFAKHNGDTCYDELHNSIARGSFTNWILDKHVKWDLVFTDTIKGEADMVFDGRSGILNLIQPSHIRQYNLEGQFLRQIDVKDGSKMWKSSGHCVFDTISGKIISYTLNDQQLTRFSFADQSWSNHPTPTQDPVHFNHARVFNPADSSFYFFGGYGHYKYHNDLFRISPNSNEVERIEYANPIPPRFGAAMGLVDGKLYIAGGKGNTVGKQAIESYFYYDLWEIDLSTKAAHKVWEIPAEEMKKGWMLSSTMAYNATDSAFYVVNMDDDGGKLLRLSLNKPKMEPASRAILNKNPYQDFDYSLIYSQALGIYVFIVDKIGVNKLHTISVYTLNSPLLDEAEIRQDIGNAHKQFPWWWLMIGGIMIALIAGGVLISKKKKAVAQQLSQKPSAPAPTTTKAEPVQPKTEEEPEPEKIFYDTNSRFIALLGCFGVRDKKGEDITSAFSPRIKQLLLLLVLNSEKSAKGISADKVTELIWNDKDERSARNNRNVTVRRLRVLLEEVGNVELKSDGGFMRLEYGNDCLCDYHELHRCYKQFQKTQDGDIDPELRGRILELLLRGTLLPNTQDEWLDQFKETTSSMALDMLSHLLKGAIANANCSVAAKIAEIMLLHDPLNEEAIAAQCQMLADQGKIGLAKSAYDRFARIYLETMGEPYGVSFAELQQRPQSPNNQ